MDGAAGDPRGQSPGEEFWGNVRYLKELGLIEDYPPEPVIRPPAMQQWKITAKGLDFLEQDGGWTAILGVVTVRLHADTVRDLLARKVEAAPLPDSEKATLLARLKRLPVEAFDKLTMKLVDAGADRSLDLLRGWLDQLGG